MITCYGCFHDPIVTTLGDQKNRLLDVVDTCNIDPQLATGLVVDASFSNTLRTLGMRMLYSQT